MKDNEIRKLLNKIFKNSVTSYRKKGKYYIITIWDDVSEKTTYICTLNQKEWSYIYDKN